MYNKPTDLTKPLICHIIPARVYSLYRNILLRLLLIVIITASTETAFSQIYPVNVVPFVKMPYPVYLSDYANSQATTDRMELHLLLRDINEINRRIKLKVYIEGNGLTAQSIDMPLGVEPIYLDGGIPHRMGSIDLAPYFRYENLMGISPEAYSRQLQEGVYNFCFEVYDYFSGQRLSGKSCIPLQIILNDPPILNMPFKAEKVLSREPQNIIFQWTPRHIGGFTTEYEITLTELWDDNQSVEAIFNTIPPIYQNTTRATTLLYGPADPLLIPGKKYAWRVQAKAIQGADYISMFRNNGYSEIYWFTYKEGSLPPINVQAEPGTHEAQISWTGQPNHQRFTVYVREKEDNYEDEWYEWDTNMQEKKVMQLRSNTTYEYKVAGFVTEDNFAESAIAEFTTNEREIPEFEGCGTEPAASEITNLDPVDNLKAGDVFTANNSAVTVEVVQGENGLFTGQGWTTLPFLGDLKILVGFKDIKVNTDYQLIEGIVETDYDEDWGNVTDVDEQIAKAGEAIEGGDDVGREATAQDLADVVVRGTIAGEDDIHLDTSTGQLKVKINGVEYPYDVSDEIQEGKPIAVSDSNGNLYSIDPQTGVASPMGTQSSPGYLAENQHDIGKVTFGAIPGDTKYAMDSYNELYEGPMTADYKTMEMPDGTTYNVPVKLMVDGKTDKVLVKVEPVTEDFDADKIIYRNLKGIKYTAVPTSAENEYTLEIPAGEVGYGIEIHAVYPDSQEEGKFQMLGKIEVQTYNQENRKLVLVPVQQGDENINLEAISKSINEIYNPYGVNFSVTLEEGFTGADWDLNGDGSLDVTGTGAFTRLTDEMRALKGSFKDYMGENLDKESQYIFMLKNAEFDEETGSLAGDMPRGHQFGYIFTEMAEKNISHTIAHELGHGIFKLHHTFHEKYAVTQSTTQNLMDYGTGQELIKHQWDILHDVGIAGAWDDDDDGMGIFDDACFVLKNLKNNLKEYFNSDSDTTLFDHVYNNFSTYLASVKDDNNNIDLESYTGWSIRAASYKEKANSFLAEKIYWNIKNGEPSDLRSKSVYLGEFTINNELYKTTVYSYKDKINITKFQTDKLCDLVGNEIVNVVVKSGYTLITFLDADKIPELVVQINGDELKVAKTWLNYLGIYSETSDWAQAKEYWASLIGNSEEELKPLPGDPLVKMKIVHTENSPTSGGMFGCARDGKGCSSSTIPALPKYNNKNKVHCGIDLSSELNTDVFAMFEGTVTKIVDDVSPNTQGTKGNFGNRVRIKSEPGQHTFGKHTIYVYYTHLNFVEGDLAVGSEIKQGQKIGESGITGNAYNISASRYHVHICVYLDGVNSINKVNPINYFTTKFDINGNKIEN